MIHAEDLRENTELEGKFALVTNAGDFRIPYHFHICRPILLEHDLPESAEELGELAAQDPDMVMKLFQSEVFLQMPMFSDDVLRALYISLRRSPDQKLALEEFLVACGAKEPVGLSLNETPRTYLFQDGIPGEIALTKNGEGYSLVSAASECSWIRIPKERWNNLDFTGDTCRIPLYFIRQSMHRGKNRGSVRIGTGRRSVSIPVTVMVEDGAEEEDRRRDQYRRHGLQLYRTLLKLYGGEFPDKALGEQAVRGMDVCDSYKKPDSRDKLLRAEVYRFLNMREEEKAVLEIGRAHV